MRDASIPPGFLRTWCDTLAQGTEMPPEAYLATGLVTVASVVGPRLVLRFSYTRRERCNLWVLNVGRSALSRKTTGMSAARWAVRVAAETLGDQIRWYGAKRFSDAQLAVDLDVVGEDTARARKAENEAAKAEGREPEEVPSVRRPHPVAWVMAMNEVASLWGEQLREWQAAAQDFLLHLFDGELSSNTRQTFVADQETFVCALGNIPPAELTARTTLGLLTSGFAGRWILLPSPAPVVPIAIPRLNGNDPMRDLAERIMHLAGVASGTGEVDVLQRMWPEGGVADRLQGEWYVRWWGLMRKESASREDEARADLWGRLQATSIKLATLLAVARQAPEAGTLEGLVVEEEDVRWAHERVEDSLESLMQVVADSGGGASTTLGKVENRIIAYLRSNGVTSAERPASMNQVAKAVKNSDSHREVIAAMESLLSVGALGIEEGWVGPKGGKPARAVWLQEG